ncbi:hypothetical protein BDW69DRAFT_188882 [Aspergillus filifer]
MRAESELAGSQLPLPTRLYRSLVVPWRLNFLDPSIAFTSIYCGLVYAMFYSFFEFFPLVYENTYNMSLGEVGLVFISVIISVFLTGITYAAFVQLVENNRGKAGNFVPPEGRLFPALIPTTDDALPKTEYQVIGKDENVPSALADIKGVGRYVAKVIADKRAQNKTLYVYNGLYRRSQFYVQVGDLGAFT